MKTITIQIKRLGLIENARIEVTPFMIFSGESGLGKSYLAILCHYFFSVWLNPKRIDSFFKEIQNTKGINFFDSQQTIPDKGEALVLQKDEFEQWLSKDAISYLSYMIGNEPKGAEITVVLPNDFPDTIKFLYEQELVGLDNAEELYYKLSVLHVTYRFKQLGIQDESPYAYLLRYAIIQELFNNFTNLEYSFVLPPSRGSYMSEELIGNTGLYKTFIAGIRNLEQAQEMRASTSERSISLLQNVMDGDIRRSEGKYIYLTHGQTLPISAAASSIRELAPLQQIITKRDLSRAAILIEEPEAHLHPLKQIMMADVTVAMSLSGANIQITTHSDYYLRRLNDLIRLHILKKKLGDKQFEQFCQENDLIADLAFDPTILSAYFLERESDYSVKVSRQDVSKGVPFDTFKLVNGRPVTNSALLYELTADEE